MMMHIVFDRATASVLNITWGFIIALSAISILALKNLRPDPNFFYFVVVVSFTVGLFNLMFGLATVSHAIKAYQDIRTEEKVKKFEQIFLSSKFIIYPPLLLLAPVINILTKESVFFSKQIFIYLSSVPGDFPAQQVRVNSGEDLLDGPEYFRLLPPARPPG